MDCDMHAMFRLHFLFQTKNNKQNETQHRDVGTSFLV